MAVRRPDAILAGVALADDAAAVLFAPWVEVWPSAKTDAARAWPENAAAALATALVQPTPACASTPQPRR